MRKSSAAVDVTASAAPLLAGADGVSTGLGRNIWANLLGKAWAAITYLALVPVYIHFLGIEAWGLVGLYLALQTLASLLDLGVTATVNRELARYSVDNSASATSRDLVRTLEVVYAGIAIVMCLGTVAASDYLARHWVNANAIPQHTVRAAIALMGGVLALQWFFGFYAGGLYGLHRQVLLNVILVVSTTVRGGGTILVLWLVSPSIVAFFVWQALASALQVAATAVALWRNLPPTSTRRPRFRATVLRSSLAFAAGVSGISIFTVIFTQLDKVLLIRLLSLMDFGYYTLAAAAAGGLYYLTSPVFQAVFPHFSSLVAAETSGYLLLKRHYHETCQLISVLILPASVVAIIFAKPVLQIWTDNTTTVSKTHMLLALLVAGTALNGLMQVPYALQLAYGWTRLALFQNGISAAVFVPLLWVMTRRYGGVGAAAVWLALNASYILIEIQVMHRRLLRGELRKWYAIDVGVPLVVAAAIAIAARMIYGADGASRIVASAWIGSVLALSLVAAAVASPLMRKRLTRRLIPGLTARRA